MTTTVNQGDAKTLTVYQYRDFRTILQYRTADLSIIPLTGWTAIGQIRVFAGGPKMADFTAVVDAPNGNITLSLTAAQTAKVKQNGVYDIELINGSNTVEFLRGRIKVVPRVSL